MTREDIINPTQVDPIFTGVSLTSGSMQQDYFQILMTALKYSILPVEIKKQSFEQKKML